MNYFQRFVHSALCAQFDMHKLKERRSRLCIQALLKGLRHKLKRTQSRNTCNIATCTKLHITLRRVIIDDVVFSNLSTVNKSYITETCMNDKLINMQFAVFAMLQDVDSNDESK